MPGYTLIILGRDDRRVRAVQEIYADTDEAARRQAEVAVSQYNGDGGALRFELWHEHRRICAEPVARV